MKQELNLRSYKKEVAREAAGKVDEDMQTDMSCRNLKQRKLSIIREILSPLTRQHSKQSSNLIDPRYLQSGAQMMVLNGMSASQAVLAMYIHDTEVYDQERFLPLLMQKK